MRIYNCSSCGNATSLIGSKKHFVENIEMDLYMCVSCGKVEFYKSNFEIPLFVLAHGLPSSSINTP